MSNKKVWNERACGQVEETGCVCVSGGGGGGSLPHHTGSGDGFGDVSYRSC